MTEAMSNIEAYEMVDQIGRDLAKIIMTKVMGCELPPEALPDFMACCVEKAMEETHKLFQKAGASETVTAVALGVIGASLCAEGRRLTALADWKGGTA